MGTTMLNTTISSVVDSVPFAEGEGDWYNIEEDWYNIEEDESWTVNDSVTDENWMLDEDDNVGSEEEKSIALLVKEVVMALLEEGKASDEEELLIAVCCVDEGAVVEIHSRNRIISHKIVFRITQ